MACWLPCGVLGQMNLSREARDGTFVLFFLLLASWNMRNCNHESDRNIAVLAISAYD